MKAKCFEVRDRMTFIPVMAVSTDADHDSPNQRYLLRRAGYSADGATILVVHLTAGNRCNNDAYGWSDRTMQTAHVYIDEHFHELADGAVVDVEFILGETTEPKTSERHE